MMSRPVVRGMALLVALALASIAVSVGAQDASPSSDANGPPSDADGAAVAYAATIREGSCAQPGDAVALLADLTAEVGPVTYEVGITAMLRSITEVTVPLPDLVDDDYTLIVQEPISGQPVACTGLGGQIVDDGMALGLVRVVDGQIGGVAWLQARGLEATTVHVFLTHPGGGALPADGAVPRATASPAARPLPGQSPRPDVSPLPGESPVPDRSPLPDMSPAPEGSPRPDLSPWPGSSPQPGGGDIDPDPEIDPEEDIDVDV